MTTIPAKRPASAETSAPAGAQTLARGIQVLKAVVAEPAGVTIQEVADRIGVHRTIAYRLLQTLADEKLVARGTDSRYRGAVGLLSLSNAGLQAFRDAAMPTLRDLSDELGATLSLLVEQGGEAVALAVVSPRNGRYHLTFVEGATHPLDRGAAGWALGSLHPPAPDDSPLLAAVREQGWARTFGEVEANAHGLAVPIPSDGVRPNACLNLISYREDVLEDALEPMLIAARRIAAL